VKKYGRSRQPTDYSVAHAHCMPDNLSKNTDTHCEYVIIFNFLQRLRERASLLH
jgi:hypothetical protein